MTPVATYPYAQAFAIVPDIPAPSCTVTAAALSMILALQIVQAVLLLDVLSVPKGPVGDRYEPPASAWPIDHPRG